MRKHKMLLIFVIIVVLFAAFVVTVIFIFNSILNNPIDSISISYIRDNTNIEKEYGKIIYIGRNILYKTKEDDFSIKRPYTIETVCHLPTSSSAVLSPATSFCFETENGVQTTPSEDLKRLEKDVSAESKHKSYSYTTCDEGYCATSASR